MTLDWAGWLTDSTISEFTILASRKVDCELFCQVAFQGQGPPLTRPQPGMFKLASPSVPLAVVCELNVPEA